PLHDIGKIHVPDAILKKQGKLTEEEYEIMKSHTTEGRKLLLHAEKSLGNFSYLDIAVEMAYGHHEWWNGKGYPQGIAEHNIPLCARIMAVADVFDAIVSQRCYKGSMSIEQAYEIIRNEKGTHFDPIVVSAFMKSRDKISEALKEFEDPMLSPKA
ncbi:MAG: HD domain-containing protein, partial [Oscillospiraceae bacterium]|nr:HD domain-containing protein [Oscillospiraceae bacterium]